LDPTLWTDDAGHSPPSYWDGTKYVFNSGPSGGPDQYIICNRAAVSGEFASATMNNLASMAGTVTGATVVEFLNTNAPAAPYWKPTSGTVAAGSYPWNTGTLSGGERLKVIGSSQFSSGYAYDFTVTPLAAPVAPNETISCAEYSSNNAVTPVITQSGSPVTGSTLAIVSSAGNGAASVSGSSLLYTPNDGYFGPDSFTYTATYNGDTSNVATVTVNVTPAVCDEIGRTTKAVASAYYRTRIQDCRLMMGEKRCLVADFNGVISSARKVASVVWKCDFGYIAQMSRARIQPDNRSAAVDILANWIGDSVLQCAATLDNGEVYMQMFRVDVSGDPIFMPAVSGNGPTVLAAP